MLYTIQTLDAEGCEIYVDDIHGLKAAKARAREMLTDPEVQHCIAKVEILDAKFVVVWDKFK